jgi:hypothetical protein
MEDTEYPANERYSAQWVMTNWDADAQLEHSELANTDMAFAASYQANHHSLPSPLLLHYRYGVAALRSWGRELSILENHPYARPSPPPKADPNLYPPVKARTDADRKALSSKPGGSSGVHGVTLALSQSTSADSIGPSIPFRQSTLETLPEDPEDKPEPFPQDIPDEEGMYIEDVPEVDRMVASLWLATPYARRAAAEEEEFTKSRFNTWRASLDPVDDLPLPKTLL